VDQGTYIRLHFLILNIVLLVTPNKYNIVERFDEQAKTWDVNPDKQKRAHTFALEITNFIKPEGKLNALEFGCGTGLLSFELKDAFNTITLVDTSAGMIDVLKKKIAKEQITHFKPLQTDLFKNEIPIENIDVIYTLMTMHHILDLHTAFKEFHKLLNKGGYLCIADLVTEDGTFHKPEMNFDGHHGFDREILSDVLKKHGFETVYYSTPHTITKDTGRKYPLFLLIAQRAS